MKKLISLFISLSLAMLIATNSSAAQPAGENDSAAEPKLTIYHIEGRRSHRVVWLCEEIGMPYKLAFTRGDMASSMQAIREVSPLIAMAPTITYGDAVLVESGAILEFLLSEHGEGLLAPERTSPDYPYYLMWLHFAESTAMPRLSLQQQRMILSGQEKIAPHVFPGTSFRMVGTEEVLQFVENWLVDNEYFGGQIFSAADIMMYFYAIAIEQTPGGVDLSPYPKFVAWRENVESRAAYQRMLEVSLPDGKSPDGRGLQGGKKIDG